MLFGIVSHAWALVRLVNVALTKSGLKLVLEMLYVSRMGIGQSAH